MFGALRHYLKVCNRDMRFYGVRVADGTLAILVRLDVPWKQDADFPVSTENRFRQLTVACKVTACWTPLACCAEQVHCNGKDWCSTLTRVDNVTDFGDMSLLPVFKEIVFPYSNYQQPGYLYTDNVRA